MTELVLLENALLELSLATDEPIRVRQLIKSLNYSALVQTQIIPNLQLVTPTVAGKRFPPWVYKLNKAGYTNIFPDFGIFTEEVVWEAINSPTKRVNLVEIWQRVCSTSAPSELNNSYSFFQGIISHFKPLFTGQQIQHNPEIVHQSIQGHPDLFGSMTDNSFWILDVKTTTNFSKMSEETFLQILSYCVLARTKGYTCNFIGVLLSLQRQILWYNVTNWNSDNFLNVLLRESHWVKDDLAIYNPLSFLSSAPAVGGAEAGEEEIMIAPNIVGSIGRILHSSVLGAHIYKENIFDRPIIRPTQIFLANPRGEGFISETEVNQIKDCVAQYPNCKVFVHAPYIINLSGDHSWGPDRLRHELIACRNFNGKGVVVHVGKYTKTDVQVALNKMEASIRQVLDYATEDCPLIIETPAGQGTELCSSLSEFINFFARFNDNRLRICVDTCHVFAAGYDPLYYIKKWLQRFPGSIVLVHFNDSEVPRGARVDRHHVPGLGHIGYTRLWAVHEYCRENHIPMVRE